MKEFNIISSIGILLILVFSCTDNNSTEAKEQVALFEESSSDWVEGGDANWNFSNGELIGTADSTVGFVMTKSVYNNFELTLDFKPDSTINSGIFIRCDSLDISATDCYEINIWDLNPNQNYRTGAIVLRTEPLSFVETLNKWNAYKILVDEDHIQIWVDGVLTTDFHNNELKEGHIGLQASGTGSIQFKNVRLKKIGH